MCDAFDKEGYYYEDSDFALDLNIQEKRRELVYLLEHDNALISLNSCRRELRNLQSIAPRDNDLLKPDDNLVALSSSRRELMNLQDSPAPRGDIRYLPKCDDGLVASNSYEQDIINAEAAYLINNNLLHTDASLADPGQIHAISKFEDTLVSPDPSALPLPIWASSDLVADWLEQSMADFTIKYYTDSVEEFFKRFDMKDEKYS